VGDPVAHPLPAVLTGMGSPTVLIGGKPAWRAMPGPAAAALAGPKAAADATCQAAEAASSAASGTPGFPAAKAAELTAKTTAAATMTALIQSSAAAAAAGAMGGMVDIHSCATPPVPPPIHGPGVVTTGSATVLINGLPAARAGDTIMEAFGPSNQIAFGEPTVIIGG
jgi:uncharacterized Zn-binding protein involved in type VI secretion